MDLATYDKIPAQAGFTGEGKGGKHLAWFWKEKKRLMSARLPAASHAHEDAILHAIWVRSK